MKAIPFLAQAMLAILFAVALAIVGVIPAYAALGFTATTYLFVGTRFWHQTVHDMRRNFDDLDNQRMLTQLSSGSGSMILPMLTVILLWPVAAALAMAIAAAEDHATGPLVRHTQ